MRHLLPMTPDEYVGKRTIVTALSGWITSREVLSVVRSIGTN